MENERVAFRVISAIESFREMSEEEKEGIMKEVMSATPEQLRGWEKVVEAAEEIRGEFHDAVTEKISSLRHKRIASVKGMKSQPKLGRLTGDVPPATVGVADNIDNGGGILKQVESLFDDELPHPIPRQ